MSYHRLCRNGFALFPWRRGAFQAQHARLRRGPQPPHSKAIGIRSAELSPNVLTAWNASPNSQATAIPELGSQPQSPASEANRTPGTRAAPPELGPHPRNSGRTPGTREADRNSGSRK
ncbi:hypothetical protein GCM10022220_25630 [Actinocatenispora rupis]|uniref:Uncharacterized protein n=1 Tax=Actinocatenispora rupis TaxID=519421 RepID=A0A8J3NBW9_9ACTN|nr:hypothetical protein Aru02nite_21290 [Actinocatenispora rupis]